MGERTQAERDAITVEIGYAVFSAALAAALVFCAIAGPALLLDPPRTAANVLLIAATAAATVVFVARIVHVLWRFPRAAASAGDGPGSGQPSQPGRTSPDS
ncbi:DUF6332 family protein [Streptomyces sp. NPDC057445]|uniref:DUF6332 family protein n=1 Tax=Streptomyces sp. NPDC057445 TaxID=3346136 RepID=UPI003698EB20